jgi:hypothetical protein
MEMMNRNTNVAGNSSPPNTSTVAGHPISQPSSSNGTTLGTPTASLTQDAMLQPIENIVSKKLGELGAYASIPSHNYVKPYSAWHDDNPFPIGYHQPKF